MTLLRNNILLLILITIAQSVAGQNICDTLNFIDCSKNKIVNSENDSSLYNFINKFNKIYDDDSEPIKIVHIGDSHLQAGFLTEKIKQELFQFISSDTIASPGFIFPYTIANTNNPYFFNVDYTGEWDVCKNIDKEKTCNLGLSGITVRTKDSIATIAIKMKNRKYNTPIKYYFNNIKILHNNSDSIEISVNNQSVCTSNGLSEIKLSEITDTLYIKIIQPGTFELYGIILENSDKKINYHTFGVNGATSQSYLKCNLLSDQIKLLDPDLIIISLGTNEAFEDNYNKLEHELILKDLILQIKEFVPNSVILLSTTNDHIKNGQFSNQNIYPVNENIIKICNDLNLSLWDFHTIMGGENSIEKWYQLGLTGNDKLHFRKLGYEIQGELFFSAFKILLDN